MVIQKSAFSSLIYNFQLINQRNAQNTSGGTDFAVPPFWLCLKYARQGFSAACWWVLAFGISHAALQTYLPFFRQVVHIQDLIFLQKIQNFCRRFQIVDGGVTAGFPVCSRRERICTGEAACARFFRIVLRRCLLRGGGSQIPRDSGPEICYTGGKRKKEHRYGVQQGDFGPSDQR